jgi:hypothetical protein
MTVMVSVTGTKTTAAADQYAERAKYNLVHHIPRLTIVRLGRRF